MTRLLPRMPRRRAERDAEPTAPPASAPPADVQPTTVLPAGGAAPAATDPAAPERPSFRDRGRLRRRLRFLRRVRELGFRDLGGLVFDQHRFGRRDEDLVDAKIAALTSVDRELRAVERALRDERPITELREAGVSACARCGALIGSDARYCSACGAPVRGARDVAPILADAPALQPAGAPPALEPARATPQPNAADSDPSADTAQRADAPTVVGAPPARPQPTEGAQEDGPAGRR